MTTSECVANFVVWRDYGVRMGIKDIPEGIEVRFLDATVMTANYK